MRSYHDDLVMALAIGCWVRDTALTINKRDLEYKKVLLDSMVTTKSSFSTTIPGMTNHKREVGLRDQFNQAQDLSWLLKG